MLCVQNGRVYVRNASVSKVDVIFGRRCLRQGEPELPLYHGATLSLPLGEWLAPEHYDKLGTWVGTFHDCRYYAVEPRSSSFVDEETGLLSVEGLSHEVLQHRLHGPPAQMLVLMPCARDDASACALALAVHASRPQSPVARVRDQVMVILPMPETVAEDLFAFLLRTNPGLQGGTHRLPHHPLLPTSTENLTRTSQQGLCQSAAIETKALVDQAADSMRRKVLARLGGSLDNLADYTMSALDIGAFIAKARELLRSGGGVALLILEDVHHLDEVDEGLCDALLLEVLVLARRVTQAQAVCVSPTRAVLALVTPSDIERVLQQIQAEWRARGPVQGEFVELERNLYCEVLRSDDLEQMAEHAQALVRSDGNSRIEHHLPLPIAEAARKAFSQAPQITRAQLLVEVVVSVWRLFAILMECVVLGELKQAAAPVVTDVPWPAPWHHAACTRSSALVAAEGPVRDLLRLLFEPSGAPGPALHEATLAATGMYNDMVRTHSRSFRTNFCERFERLERAVRKLLWSLRPLRRWTLLTITQVDWDTTHQRALQGSGWVKLPENECSPYE